MNDERLGPKRIFILEYQERMRSNSENTRGDLTCIVLRALLAARGMNVCGAGGIFRNAICFRNEGEFCINDYRVEEIESYRY